MNVRDTAAHRTVLTVTARATAERRGAQRSVSSYEILGRGGPGGEETRGVPIRLGGKGEGG